MPSFENRTIIGVTSDALDQWHQSPGALRRLSPPWDRVEVLQEPPAIENGALVKLRVKAGPAWTRWTVEHFDCPAWPWFLRPATGRTFCRLDAQSHFQQPGRWQE